MTMPKPDCYDYVRRCYGVPAFAGARVTVQNRGAGVLVQRRTGDQYVYIRFDGEPKATGPWHPTDGITYEVPGGR